MTAQAIRRLFFALWPDEAIQRRLADAGRGLADETQGKATAWHNIHATLAFLDDVPDDMISELVKLAYGQRDFASDCLLKIRVGAGLRQATNQVAQENFVELQLGAF